jgi:hypothetical protein
MHCDDAEMMVIKDLRAKNIKLCVVSEGHWIGCGIRQCDDYYILYSGHEVNHYGGVGFILHHSIYRLWWEGGKMWQHVSHRLATLTIPLAGSASKRNLTLVGVYAPTNDPKHRAQSEAFYEELQTVLDDLPASHLMMVLGDFNARVGGFDEDLAKIVGRFGIDDLNDNGRRLMQSCVKNDLAVMGTFFSHK